MMVKIVGIGEYMISNCRKDSIKTFALASCVGVVVYNFKEKVLGMVHVVLPDTRENEDGVSKDRMGYFADTAIPFIFGKVFGGYPSQKNDYRVSLYGGASSRNKNDIFFVGAKNIARIEQILGEHQIYYDKKNTGGYCSRTIEAFVEDGRVILHTQNMNM